MKKKTIAIYTIAIITVIFCAWLLLRPKAIGDINESFTEATTSNSVISFTADKGDRVKFSLRSDISAGSLEIIVYSSDGKEVYVLDHAEELEAYFTFDNSGTYTLKAEYTDFIGSFKIAVYPANER